MGAFISSFFGQAPAVGATADAVDPIQKELEDAAQLLQLELQMFSSQSAEAETKMKQYLARHETLAARIQWDICQGLKPQSDAVQQALRVVNEQLRISYHNKLNRTTMDLMRRSAAAYNKKGMNIDAASDAVDNLADAAETAFNVASTLADESVTNRTTADHEWAEMLQSAGIGNAVVGEKVAVMEAEMLPEAPSETLHVQSGGEGISAVAI